MTLIKGIYYVGKRSLFRLLKVPLVVAVKFNLQGIGQIFTTKVGYEN
jgi:hypothetical protein